ncbi:helix-turn-helix domain-containing protein [Fluviispira multicolorata]|uniref:Helix-turn-helix domain-containing protein n=1 Tax=Fluviispira multicolorata TaxID=2654512 RepID=A0A833N1F8_9BACT|nr:helix-turn-helix domain-containing protein [Fluviispira multicolorata]KAB8030785.1 hypothetical protein GCL57_07370 [Fluviispira multicolorata]
MAKKLMQRSKEIQASGHWLKLNEAAQLLQTSEITLRRKVKSGKIKSEFRDGKYYIFIKDDLYKEKKEEIIHFESYLKDKEIELRELKKQIIDQKILIEILERKLNLI